MNNSVKSISGRIIKLTKPSVFDIMIEDIAHSLSNIVRFTGHLHSRYTVAEHSINVAKTLKNLGVDWKTELCGLLHDSTEYILGDVSSPLKSLLPEYKKIENNLWTTIALKYELPDPMPRIIKDVDKYWLKIEIEKYQNNYTPAMSHKKAKEMFLNKYYEITFRRHGE